MNKKIKQALEATGNYPVKVTVCPHNKSKFKVTTWYGRSNHITSRLLKLLQQQMPEIKDVYMVESLKGNLNTIISLA